MDNEQIIHTIIGIVVGIFGFVVTTALAIFGYFLRKRDAMVDAHSQTLSSHSDRIKEVEIRVGALADDVREIKDEVKGVRGDTAEIKLKTAEMKALLEAVVKKN